jgi:hypothetical protein
MRLMKPSPSRPTANFCRRRSYEASTGHDRPDQGLFVETAPGAAVDKFTVDDHGRQAADALTTGRHHDVGIVHVANFDIVFGARQEVHEFHSLSSNGAPSCKDLDFSPPRQVQCRCSRINASSP